jgi:hypothetical protein
LIKVLFAFKGAFMTEQIQTENSNHDTKINLKESLDVNYWCEVLNLRADELGEIVKQVGPAVHDVRLHLAKKLLINWPVSY